MSFFEDFLIQGFLQRLVYFCDLLFPDTGLMFFSHFVGNIDGVVVLGIFDMAVNNRLLSEILAFNLETAAPIASFMLILNGISHSISQEIQEIG